MTNVVSIPADGQAGKKKKGLKKSLKKKLKEARLRASEQAMVISGQPMQVELRLVKTIY